jgi:hypothetical protein
MRFWWVNHNQTFRQEFKGKYIWCPKRMQNGRVSHFYESVREVRPGDLVFSYARSAVQGFGFATTHCYSCPKPDEFGKLGDAWDHRGWRVDVNFRSFQQPVRTIDHAQDLRPHLPKQYSPIRENGYGNQAAYFTEVPENLALAVARLADPFLAHVIRGETAAEGSSEWEVQLATIQEWENRQQQLILERMDISQTTRSALVQARIGQGRFKQNVAEWEHACRITGVSNPTHLIASHIKPWRESVDEERLVAGNGLLLTPSIDHLFDRGFITFDDDGEVILSPIADQSSLQRMGVDTDPPRNVGSFNTDQKHFLQYHREEIFLKSAS